MATLRGAIGVNVLQLVVLGSALEAGLVRIHPQVLMARIALAWDLLPRQGNVTVETVQVKMRTNGLLYFLFHFITLKTSCCTDRAQLGFSLFSFCS